MIKVIAFDCDNTIYKINARKGYEKMFEFLSQKLGVSKEEVKNTWEEIVKRVKGSKNPEKRRREYSLRLLLKEFKVSEEVSPFLVETSLEVFWKEVARNLSFRKGLRKRFQKLRKRFTLAIVSEEFEENLEKKLRKVLGKDWRKYFKTIVTPERTGRMKPSTKFYRILSQELGVSPKEVLVVGDSLEKDLLPAKKLGCLCLFADWKSCVDCLKVC